MLMADHSKLKRALSDWQHAWEGLLDVLSSLTPEQITAAPPSGGWSMQQVVQHLYLSEKRSITAVGRRLDKPESLQEASLASAFRSLALNAALASPLKFKAPAGAGVVAFEEETWSATLHNLTELHAHIHRQIAAIPPALIGKTLYTHPRAGRLTLRAMFRFFTWHVRHHKRQVEGILRGP
jgi:hypothetical protein